MRRLILMRHAKSDWSQQGRSDHDRTLNARGKRSALALGDWLRRNGYMPDEILCSSATRTRETLAGLDLPSAIPTSFSRALYLTEAEDMLEILQAAQGQCVLMIGHNNGISDLAQRLVIDPPDHARFADYPTGATLVVEFDTGPWNDIGWHTGQPIDFVVPRDLPGMA